MTIAGRTKSCIECGSFFIESKRTSNKEWHGRRFCCIQCKNLNTSRANKIDIKIRLENKQIKNGENECWGWSGAKDSHGYGIISNRNTANASPEKAHRVSFELMNGEIPHGLVVRHKCDNPECTNPKHLEVGTQKQNMQDCSSRGRLNQSSLNNLISGAKGYMGAAIGKNKVNHG